MQECLICGSTLSNDLELAFILSFKEETKALICDDCKKLFVSLKHQSICQKCGRKTDELECDDCRRWNDQLVNRSLYQYNDAMKEFFRRYKFDGDYWLRKAFQDEFVNYIQKNVKNDEIIVPIPVDNHTMKTRGFNQVMGLIEPLNLPEVLVNQRDGKSKHQFQRSRKERLKQHSTFQVKNAIKLDGKKVVLIDDIYTTGTTLRLVAKILEKAGVIAVRSITLCR